MKGAIFINYRRSLSLEQAQLLHTCLCEVFPRRRVFLDVHGLETGSDWVAVLERQVRGSALMLVLIPPGWFEERDENGERRLENPNDFVRTEILTAQGRNVDIVPILVNGAEMPEPQDLPRALQFLCGLQATLFRSESYTADGKEIAAEARRRLSARRAVSVPLSLAGAASTFALLAGLAAGPSLERSFPSIHAALGLAPARSAPAKDAERAAGPAPQTVEKLRGLETELAGYKRRLAKSELALRDAVAQIAASKTIERATEPPGAPPAPRSGDEPAKIFSDCERCPRMIRIDGGEFRMGSPRSEAGRLADEGPERTVRVDPFAIGVYEIRFAEWEACVADGFCPGGVPNDSGWGKGDRPVINVSWRDIAEPRGFLAWINSKVPGAPYRLPSEAEWEYANRAGAQSRYAWGDEFDRSKAISGAERTQPVGSRPPNAFQLYDTHGNVWEWVADCWNDSYQGAPDDARAWRRGNCELSILRGGSWYEESSKLRSAFRNSVRKDARNYRAGFRIARDL